MFAKVKLGAVVWLFTLFFTVKRGAAPSAALSPELSTDPDKDGSALLYGVGLICKERRITRY